MVVPKLSNKLEGRSDEKYESEKKRLQSLQERKQAFKAKGKAVQDALKDLFAKPRNNKIIFDEDIDQVVETKPKKGDKLELFENDEEKCENEVEWDIKEFEARRKKENVKILGADQRFRLDKRFVEDEPEDKSNEDEGEDEDESCNLEKEKQQQLGILESILGAPISKKKDTKDAAKQATKKKMIRYDPTANNHEEYEIAAEKSEPPAKKGKKKKREEKEPVNESIPEVSKDIYFSVSESLSQRLAEKGQFSLLKAFGREEPKVKEDIPTAVEKEEKPKKFHFSFDTKNPFKYDSSDNENEHENEDQGYAKSIDTGEVENNEDNTKRKKNIFGTTDRFFFEPNDSRFNEAIQFFSKESAPKEEFQSLRRELKQLVRTKIRRNIQKTHPWSNKKKVKRLNT